MLKKVQFSNFKALRDVEIPLHPITALIGPNGSGKSSILDGIHLVSQLALPNRREDQDAWGRIGAVFKGERQPERLRTSGEDGPLRLAVTRTEGQQLEVAFLPLDDQGWQPRLSYPNNQTYADPTAHGGALAALLNELPRDLGAVVRLRLDPFKLARPSYSEEEVPRLEHDGAGLASVLADVATTAPEVREAIEDSLKKVVPDVGRIRTPRAELTRHEKLIEVEGEAIATRTVERKVWGHRLQLQMFGEYVDADLLSDGTLIALALLTLLHGPERPRVILLDDLDRGFHPRAQQTIVGLLRQFQATANGDVQFVVTTHSPYLLDAMRDDEIFALRLDSRGRTICRQLKDHPDWSEWRDRMQMGEFWSTVGEDWVVEAAE